MSKEQLQKEIISKEGIIFSEGTHNLNRLLPSAYDLIVAYDLDQEDGKAKEIAAAIEKVFNTDPKNEKTLPTYYNQYYSNIHIPKENQEEAGYIFNEDIFNYFNDIAPEGFYFSSHPGDGSCFGFWKIENVSINRFNSLENLIYEFLLLQSASFGSKAIWWEENKWCTTETSNRKSPGQS